MKPLLAKKNKCTGCAACTDSCSRGAIHMMYDNNGFLYPTIDESSCIGCGVCTKYCPIINYDKLPFRDVQKVNHYAAWSENDEICRKSSSGGIFTQLAINLLQKQNAIVFGVEASKDNTCYHRSVHHIEDLQKIAGTKYIQSNAEGSYKEAKNALSQGLTVLYCGTPCQIAALYAYLGYKDHQKLYTVELICHGVASKVTADLVTAFNGGSFIYSYRDKEEGWCKPGLRRVSQTSTYCMSDGSLVRPSINIFFRCFAVTHRISCTQCPFAQIPRLADLSLGDLWGLYKKYSERGELGASLVLCNTSKGGILLKSGQIKIFKHENSELNCYTIFYPGASRYAQFSQWLFLIKQLRIRIAIQVLLLDWRKNILLLPFKIMFHIFSKQHIKRTLKMIEKRKNELGWK